MTKHRKQITIHVGLAPHGKAHHCACAGAPIPEEELQEASRRSLERLEDFFKTRLARPRCSSPSRP